MEITSEYGSQDSNNQLGMDNANLSLPCQQLTLNLGAKLDA